MTYRTLSKWFLLAAFVFGMTQVMAARLKDMAVVSGQRPNQLIGYGLVVVDIIALAISKKAQ